jgi:hypothetical protein
MKEGQKVMVINTLLNNYKQGEIVTCIGEAKAKFKQTPNGEPYAHLFSNGKLEQHLSADEYILITTPFMRRLYAQLFNK